ncbi:hypothetical protein H9Y05_10335 [Crocinitomicaceae bacterium CZZ-1]|uniref:Secretion system C-terminal sorting domain-containing protein n=1 Tax=Taishania pollutisoli TaxID=2766479 RepID=A0A8J6PD37_9FLAO|nr:hypothetical protein [Taishania pollutisoli]MBC9812867.1 hypothetical protein [Taishania pollutisoli]NGF76102.1 hypothetical protein [Fluviicola sp. SGL-29]
MILAFTTMEVVVGILIFTLAILVLVISYKKLLAYLGKGSLPKEKYCVLYSLETEPAAGEIQFYFTSEEKKEVKLQLLDEQYNFLKEIYNKECRADGNIIPFNTTELSNGIYFYCLVTENQKTMKKMTIRN